VANRRKEKDSTVSSPQLHLQGKKPNVKHSFNRKMTKKATEMISSYGLINNLGSAVQNFQNYQNFSNMNFVQKFQTNPLEKIEEVQAIRNELIDEYTKITMKSYQERKKNLISKWKSTIELLQTVDVKLLLYSMKCLADIYLEFDEYEMAKNFYFYFKFFSNYMELPEEMMMAYESLGNVYKYLFQYNKSIKCYKKQIEIAWAIGDKVSELRAYDNIGIQYFYLGNREKAKYYHERMLYGRSEGVKSKIKEKTIESYKNKNFHMYVDEKYIKNNGPEELKEKFK